MENPNDVQHYLVELVDDDMLAYREAPTPWEKITSYTSKLGIRGEPLCGIVQALGIHRFLAFTPPSKRVPHDRTDIALGHWREAQPTGGHLR